MWGTPPTSPGIRLRRIALAILSWLSPIRRPGRWSTLIGAILRPCGAGTRKSEICTCSVSDNHWMGGRSPTRVKAGGGRGYRRNSWRRQATHARRGDCRITPWRPG